MGVSNLNDEQLKEFANDPKKFIAVKKNMTQIIGLDSSTKRRVADILQYEEGLSKAQVKDRISKIAGTYETVTYTTK